MRQSRSHDAGGTPLFAKINHVAIVSERYAPLAAFYQSLFGMSTSERTRTNRAITVGDGYVGLNINPRKAGRPAGLDHFDVLDLDAAVRRHHRQRSRRQCVRSFA